METKKVFVGSLYEFGLEARTDTINEYRDDLPQGTVRPFISYDERRHLFSLTCDRADTTTVSSFFGRVDAYVNVFEQKGPENFYQKGPEDFYLSSPKLKPMQGTVINDTLILEDQDIPGEELIGISQDDDSCIDEPKPGFNSPYWTPNIGDSHMLTKDIAAAIVDATNASFWPEHDRNRVIIIGGDFNEALLKLRTLEPLMDLLARQRKDGSTRPSTNMLMQASLGDLSTLDFKVVSSCALAIERIVVDRGSSKYLDKKCMTQVLHRDPEDRNGPWLTPGNMTLDEVRGSVTVTEGYSQVWAEKAYPTFGKPVSAKPIETFVITSVPIMPPQKFVTASKAHDIVEWNADIDEGVNPEEIAVEAPSEAMPVKERGRVVRVDSDDEEDDGLAKITGRPRQIASSDDGDQKIIAASLAAAEIETQSGRVRHVADDSDSEEEKDHSPVWEPSSSQPLSQPTWISHSFSAIEKDIDTSRMHPASPKLPSPEEFDPNKHNRGDLEPPSCGVAQGGRATFRGASGFQPQGSSNARGRGSFSQQCNYRPPNLVNLAENPVSSENMPPPPGLDLRIETIIPMSSSSPEVNLLDGPLEEIQRPSIKPEQAVSEHSQELDSAEAKKSSNVSSRSGGVGYVNIYNPPKDIGAMENKQLAELKRMKDADKLKKKLAKEAENGQSQNSASTSAAHALRGGPQKKAKNDEASSRRFHQTMKQQAPKPNNKGKQAGSKMTAKEKQKKLEELFGEPASSSAPSKETFSQGANGEKMSKRKQEALKKNPELDHETAAKLAETKLCARQTAKLIEVLTPLFEAGRAFRGNLQFEIQIGQVLIANSKDLVTENVQYTSTKTWESRFSPSLGKGTPPGTAFTNILSRNGHDIDRILKIKPARGIEGRGPAKLFNESKPGPISTSYEFHCQTQESEEFWIIVDATGNHHVRKSIATVGTVNLHYPANIWDARAILHGTADFCELETSIATMVDSFMNTVFVPADNKVSITYRQPADNDMTVRSVTVKRGSLHSCFFMDAQDIHLQITEVKTLFHRFHQKDKKLSQSFEKDYQEMLTSDHIHYEVSLVHKGINEAFKQNQALEIGTLTNLTTIAESLLGTYNIQNMLYIVSHVISKIDWAGVRNNGTLLRMQQEQEALNARVANTILPGTRPTVSYTGLNSTAAGARLRSNIPGIRMNTLAEVGADADGNAVWIGQGGAMIPIVDDEEVEKNLQNGDLAPNDSASQIGGSRPPPSAALAAHAREATVRGKSFW